MSDFCIFSSLMRRKVNAVRSVFCLCSLFAVRLLADIRYVPEPSLPKPKPKPKPGPPSDPSLSRQGGRSQGALLAVTAITWCINEPQGATCWDSTASPDAPSTISINHIHTSPNLGWRRWRPPHAYRSTISHTYIIIQASPASHCTYDTF